MLEDVKQAQAKIITLVDSILAQAKSQGATDAEVAVTYSNGIAVSARKGEVENIEFTKDQGFGVTVYRGLSKGSASTSDTAEQSVVDTVKAALEIAKHTAEDDCNGLGEAQRMPDALPDLDLYHPWEVEPEQLIEYALRCEAAGFAVDSKVTNSEGAEVSSNNGLRCYGNSSGFIGCYPASRHSASCVLVAEQKQEMQRDYWYHSARIASQLPGFDVIGQKAAQRALDRLGPRKVPTGNVPVIFSADVASSLLGSFLGAISGGALYRQSSFLLDRLHSQVFPSFIDIEERPLLPQAMGSASFDGDGLKTYQKHFIQEGQLVNYLLSSYSGRKLGMPSTANAGGVRNLFITSHESDPQKDLPGLLKQMGTGLLVTELMGQGVNMVTGDYSRGAGGFWVENGEVQYPVAEVTIAGNLADMFMQIVSVGDDVDHRGNIHTGSILIEKMALAGS